MVKCIFILTVICLVSCDRNPYNYTLEEIYKDYYKQQDVEKLLSLKERSLIDQAEVRYEKQGKLSELKQMTLRQIINEQESLSDINNISKKINIEVIKRDIKKNNYGTFLKWDLKITNNSGFNIDKLQGWMSFTDIHSKEILRVDTLDCTETIENKSTITFITQQHDYNPNEKANQILMKLTTKELNKMIKFTATLIRFQDGTELTTTTN